MNFFIKIFASGFYTGLFPFMPGTIGSLAAVLVAWFLKPNLGQIIFLTILGIYICAKGEELFAEHDCGKIVYDEFCGMFLAVWGLNTPIQFLVGFVLFRVFDITKPFPINKIQVLPGGWGIMADDLLAGGFVRLLLAFLITTGIF